MTVVGRLATWVPPSGPSTLAAIRVIVAAQALWIVLSRDPAGVSALPAAVWQFVGPEARLRYLLVPGVPVLEAALWAAAVASLAFVLLGLHTRIFGIVAAVLLYHLAPLQALLSVAGPWGKGLTIAILALPVLACSPCEDRWAIGREAAPPRDPQAYGWAVCLSRLLFAQIYLFTALGRLLTAGLDWAAVDSVRTHLLLFAMVHPHLDTPLNAWLVARPVACGLLAALTLVFELLFVFAVFVRSVRLPLAVAGVAFHAGLWLTLGFRFPNIAHFLMFVDLDRPPRPAPARSPRAAAETGPQDASQALPSQGQGDGRGG